MKVEIPRQALHLIGGLILAGAMFFLEVKDVQILMAVLLGIGIFLSQGMQKKLIKSKFLAKMIKVTERKGTFMLGQPAITFALGILLVSLLFPVKMTIIGATLVVAVGDAFSTLIGKRFGKIKTIRTMTLEGTVAGIIFATIALYPFFPLQKAFITAAIAMLSEYFPLDDNVVIPIVAAAVLTIMP